MEQKNINKKSTKKGSKTINKPKATVKSKSSLNTNNKKKSLSSKTNNIFNNKLKEKETKQKNIKKIFDKYLTKRNIIILASVLVLLIPIIIYVYANRDIDSVILETKAHEIYEWKYNIENKGIMKYKRKQISGDIEGKTIEGRIIEKYYFQALKPGKTTLSFTYTNTNNGSFLDTKNYTATVSKNLKLKIEEQK